MLKATADNTVQLLEKELQIRLSRTWRKLAFFISPKKYLFQERIYILIEECKTWDAVLKAIDGGLEPFKQKF